MVALTSPRIAGGVENGSGSDGAGGPGLTDPLKRRGALGAGFRVNEDGKVEVTVLRQGGAAAQAGVKVGDVIVAVDGAAVAEVESIVARCKAVGAGGTITFTRAGAGQGEEIRITLGDVPTEKLEHSTVTYSSVEVPAGYRVRTIITEPKKVEGKAGTKHPAFMFVQGIFCASLDRPESPEAVDTRLVHEMAGSGFVTLRVDKPGLGDSAGPPCGDIDFETELAVYAAALRQLKSLDSVDPERVYVFGHSMGGVMAPYLAREVGVRGAAVYGTLARTWLEYSLENVRRQSRLMGVGEADVTDQVLAQAKMLAPVLIEKKTLGDVWAKHPELRPPDASAMLEPERMYSRHMRFYHQLQDLNLARAWSGVSSNVLAIHGEYDWVVSEADHRMIAELVNGNAAGKGEFLTLPQADHGFTLHESLDASRSAMGRGRWDGSLTKAVLDWVARVEGKAAHAAPAGGAERAAERGGVRDGGRGALHPGGGVNAEAEPAADAAFPQAWLGHWRGEAELTGGTRATKFTTELIITATDKPDRFGWAIIYDGEAGRQTRPYTLVVKDASKGEYVIDEGNGIEISTRWIGGTLYGNFLVMGNRIATRERLEDAGTASERITIEMVTTREDAAAKSGGKGEIPQVQSWSAVALQRATLRRVKADQAPATKAGGADAGAGAGTGAKTIAWKKLNTTPYRGKQDDIAFVTPETGWYVNGAGKIYKTTDGGGSFTEQLSKPGTYFRCIAFVDERLGFAGNIGPDYFPNVSDATPLYRTEDGGSTWSAVAIEGDPVKGLCALEVVRWPFINAGKLEERSMIVAGGRVGGPAVFLKSTDNGATWRARDLSAECGMILDVHFFDDKRGLIAAASSASVQDSNAVILATEDGGESWKKVYQSSRPFELTWKMSFPTRDIGFVTIQSYNPDKAASKRYVAKTADGGRSWTEIEVVDDHAVRCFGVGFADERLGWIGAMPGGFETRDGGATWARVDMGNAVNKIRIVKSEKGFVAYAIGVEVFKFDALGP